MAGHRADGADPVDGPVDLAAVRADDALIDAVHGRDTGAAPGRADEELVGLLAAWRAEVDARELPELVTLDEAVAAVESGRPAPPARSRPRLLRRVSLVAAAAAAAVLAVLGFGAAVHSAMPGQPLWGVSRVVFAERAASVQNAVDAQESLSRADQAIARRDLPAAQSLLDGADSHIDAVRPEDRAALEAERRRVLSSLGPEAPAPAVTPDATSAAAGTAPAPPSRPTTTATPTTVAGTPPVTGTSSPDAGESSTTTTTTPPPLLPLPGS